MANIASSKKDARRSQRRAMANRALRAAVKTRITKARRAIADGGEEVAELARQALSSLDRAASKGVLHRNNAARRKARLMRRLNAVAAVDAEAPAPAPAGRAARGRGAAPAPAAQPAKTARRPAAKAATKPEAKASRPARNRRTN